ncbi:MAG: energy-coupling factor ABC transporter permease, partial [Betaproteobacteria bacterium]|nr:energy-coupling factor ABC transporter permease [Betaproteobacteria bacterium]
MGMWWLDTADWARLAGALLAAALLALAVPRSLRQLDAHPALAPVAAVTAMVLPLLWRARAGGLHDIDLHLLGVALATLMLGPWLAVAAVALACVFTTLWQSALWVNLGLNILLLALPVLTTQAMLRATQRWLPSNIFVFNLGVGMVGVFAASAAAVLLQAAVWAALAPAATARRVDEALPFALLLMWGEGLTSGLLVSVLTAYRPQWIVAFDDARYLRPP